MSQVFHIHTGLYTLEAMKILEMVPRCIVQYDDWPLDLKSARDVRLQHKLKLSLLTQNTCFMPDFGWSEQKVSSFGIGWRERMDGSVWSTLDRVDELNDLLLDRFVTEQEREIIDMIFWRIPRHFIIGNDGELLLKILVHDGAGTTVSLDGEDAQVTEEKIKHSLVYLGNESNLDVRVIKDVIIRGDLGKYRKSSVERIIGCPLDPFKTGMLEYYRKEIERTNDTILEMDKAIDSIRFSRGSAIREEDWSAYNECNKKTVTLRESIKKLLRKMVMDMVEYYKILC